MGWSHGSLSGRCALPGKEIQLGRAGHHYVAKGTPMGWGSGSPCGRGAGEWGNGSLSGKESLTPFMAKAHYLARKPK